MKSLLLKVPQDAAERFFAGQTSCLPCSQIPDMPLAAFHLKREPEEWRWVKH